MTRETITERKRRILVLGFYRIASSFLAELERRNSALLEQVVVVDFNPNVYRALQERGVRSSTTTLPTPIRWLHAGIADAEIVISSVRIRF
jgi:homospermidine synthase